MFDIADKLFPNLLTLLTQLAATGVIYLLYRKYLHEPVMAYLDRQAVELNEAQNYADKVEQEAELKSLALEKEHSEKTEALRRSQEAMKREAEQERENQLKRTEDEKARMLKQARNEIEKDRLAMFKEVEKHVLDLAVDVTERTLENYTYDEEEVFQVLESELEQMSK